MKRIEIKQLMKSSEEGQQVELAGWVRSCRVSKNVAFVVLNDGSCQDNIQVVFEADRPDFEKLHGVGTGAALSVSGLMKRSEGKGQAWEVAGQKLIIHGPSTPDYPLQKKGHSLEFLREISHLRPRTNTFGAVFRVRNALAYAVHNFFQGRGFHWAHTPIITASDCEGAGEMFAVSTLDMNNLPRDTQGRVDYAKDFFGKQAHLTVSGQLEAEFLAMSLGKVYTFGPTFRAENSNTTRHLSEFWMIEPEIAFADLDDDIELAGDFLRALCRNVLASCPEELAFLEKMYKNTKISDLEELAEAKLHRITYTDAIKELERAQVKFEFPVQWGADLQAEHERYLTEKVFRAPVAVTNYPKDIKAFYMRVNDDEKTVAAMDVLVPKVGELIGGSQREERLEVLQRRIAEFNLPQAELAWYLDLRRFGTAPHAGFGLGFERLVQYVTGMGNIRDVIPCPRAPGLIGF